MDLGREKLVQAAQESNRIAIKVGEEAVAFSWGSLAFSANLIRGVIGQTTSWSQEFTRGFMHPDQLGQPLATNQNPGGEDKTANELPFYPFVRPVERLGNSALNMVVSNTIAAERRVLGTAQDVRQAGEMLLGVYTKPSDSTHNAERALAEFRFSDVDAMTESLEERLEERLEAHLYPRESDEYKEAVIRKANLKEITILCEKLCPRAVDLLRDPEQDWERTEKRLEKLSVMFQEMPKGFYKNLGMPADDIKLLEEYFSLADHTPET